MRLAVLVCLALGATSAFAQDDTPFDPGCPLPFAGEPHPIDNDCGIEGKSANEKKKAESKAKNNFCATSLTGTPTWTTFVTFRKLKDETSADGFELKPDRSGAKNLHTTNPSGETIGEGSLVKLAAFVLEAHIANESGGENVNCSRGGRPRNDIHIHLAQTHSKEPGNFCKAVVAEVSPHQRPDEMNHGDLMLTNNGANRHPVRLTGHLFFDGNHPVTCNMASPSKSRASTWEIHPVYKIEVCKNTTLASCDARDDSKWITLTAFIQSLEEEEGDDDDP